jgi:uncharacterized protein YfdQ (DUF2303 family)
VTFVDRTTDGGAVPESAVVADLAEQALGVVQSEGAAHIVMGDARVIDLERHAAAPWRPRGTAYPKSVDAFVAYVRRHLTGSTTVWVEPLEGKVVAVLNDHREGQGPEWGDLRAELILPVTPEWTHWTSRDRRFGSQQEFAEHVEDGLDDVRDPAGATLLEIAQTMQATVNAEFRSASRLHDGTIAMQWTEHIDARAGSAGDLTIPQEITLGLAPFYGEQPYEVRARIRYRISGGNLTIGYVLDRPDVVIRDCLTGIRERLSEEFGDGVFIGQPAAPVQPTRG